MNSALHALGFRKPEETETSIRTLLQEQGFAQDVIQTHVSAQELPSFWIRLLLGGLTMALMTKYHLVVLTNQHLIIITLGMTSNFKSYTAYLLSEVNVKKFSTGVLSNTLCLELSEGKKMTLTISSVKGGKDKVRMIATALQK